MSMNDIFYALLTVLLPLVMSYVFDILSEKVADSKYAGAVNAVFDAVCYVNQTFVDSLKESGEFDAKAKQVALIQAKDAALCIMKKSTRTWLEKRVDNLDDWLEIQIESAVKQNKL